MRIDRFYSHSASRFSTLLAATAFVLLTAGGGAAAQTVDDTQTSAHGHVSVEPDPGLGWHELLETTVTHYPSYLELAARATEAEAWVERAHKWLSAQPSLALGVMSDAALDDTGLVEYDSALVLPLWQLGQRGAAHDVGDAATEEAAAAASALRWEVAGRLRGALWDIALAENDLAIAAEAVEIMRDIEQAVSRRVETGDLAREDALLARAELLGRQTALLDAETSLVDAQRAYQALTGIARRPADFAEPLSTRQDFDASHPLIALAETEIERSRAELDFGKRAARGTPTLSIGPRRQRDPFTPYYVDSLSVGVSIPFGGRAHQATATAPLDRRVATAQAHRAQVTLQLEAQLHEALHTHEMLEEARPLAAMRAELARQYAAMGQVAFEAGEIDLQAWLRREQAAQAARLEAEALAIREQQSVAAINQALGELP